jgi:hypothetical protein
LPLFLHIMCPIGGFRADLANHGVQASLGMEVAGNRAKYGFSSQFMPVNPVLSQFLNLESPHTGFLRSFFLRHNQLDPGDLENAACRALVPR